MHFYKDIGKGPKLHAGPLRCRGAATRQLQRIVGRSEKMAGLDWLETAASWQVIGSTVAWGCLCRHNPSIPL